MLTTQRSTAAPTFAGTTAPVPPTRGEILDDPVGDLKVHRRGTHRSRPLEETLRLAWSCRATAGISRVADITDLDEIGIPVVSAYRPLAEAGNLTVSNGKGLSLLAAAVSGLMEAVERYCGEVGDRRGIEASFAALVGQGRSALHPRRLVLRRDCGWTPETPCEWWPMREVHSDREVLVPAAAVFVPFARSAELGGSTSNGLAAGNCLPEAILHGLYELIERDATAFGSTLQQGVVVDSATFPAEASLIAARIQDNGIRVRCFSFANDLDIPVFYTVVDDQRAADPLLINSGAGCHLDPTVALCRALTEAVQSRLCVIAGARDDLDRQEPRRQRSYAEARTALLGWEQGWSEGSFGDIPDASTESINGDLRILVGRLQQRGFPHLLCADLTLPGLPFHVCRTIVPGFEFFNQDPARLGGRLYRALLAAGKITEAPVDAV
jgi:ribosomal protein S12 methylthiotransferase accessory factor